MRRALPAVGLIAALASTGAHAAIRVFELRNATPESVLPVVQPLLGPHESASPYRSALVVKIGRASCRERVYVLV